MGRVTVVGSINMDIVTSAPRLPRVGETIAGTAVQFLPGGKGANQAVAAARMGATTVMIGRVGADGFGDQMVTFLRAQGVETAGIGTELELATGIAVVVVQADGDNAILVVPGANQALLAKHVTANVGGRGDIVVAQLEVPEATVAAAFTSARAAGVTTILNAAPASRISAELLADTDVLVVNEVELATLIGRDAVNETEVVSAARSLRNHEAQVVVVTLGSRGSVAVVGDRVVETAAQAVAVVDTTGAGDCFVGSMAAQLAGGASLESAIGTATAAASICVGRPGAGGAMPYRDEVLGPADSRAPEPFRTAVEP